MRGVFFQRKLQSAFPFLFLGIASATLSTSTSALADRCDDVGRGAWTATDWINLKRLVETGTVADKDLVVHSDKLNACKDRLAQYGLRDCMANFALYLEERTRSLRTDASGARTHSMGLTISDRENYAATQDMKIPSPIEEALPLPAHGELDRILETLFMRGKPSDATIDAVEPARLRSMVRWLRDSGSKFIVYHSQTVRNPNDAGTNNSYGRLLVWTPGSSGQRDLFTQVTTSVSGEPQQLVDMIGMRQGSSGPTMAFKQFWRSPQGGLPARDRIQVHGYGVESCAGCHSDGLRELHPIEMTSRVAGGQRDPWIGVVKPNQSPEKKAWFEKQLSEMNSRIREYGQVNLPGSNISPASVKFPYFGDFGVKPGPWRGRDFPNAASMLNACLSEPPAAAAQVAATRVSTPSYARFLRITDPDRRKKIISASNCASCHNGEFRQQLGNQVYPVTLHAKIVLDRSMPPHLSLGGENDLTENERLALYSCLEELQESQIPSWTSSVDCGSAGQQACVESQSDEVISGAVASVAKSATSSLFSLPGERANLNCTPPAAMRGRVLKGDLETESSTVPVSAPAIRGSAESGGR